MTIRHRTGRLGIRKYGEKFIAESGRGRQYAEAMRWTVESFLSALPRARITDLRRDSLDTWQEKAREAGYAGSTLKQMLGRLITLWKFAYAHGDNHNPPPERPGGGGYDWGEESTVESAQPDDPLPPYCCEAGRAFVTINGIRHDLGEAESSKSQVVYTRLIAEFEVSGRASYFGLPVESLTVAELLAHYDRFATRHYGPGRYTEAARVRYAVKYMGLYHDLPACQFGALQLQAVRMRVHAAGNTRKYCNSVVQCIQRVFRWAASQCLVPAEVPHRVASVAGWRQGRCPARESVPVSPVSIEDVAATLPHLLPVVRAMVQLQLLTAARPGEVCRLRPCDVDRSGDVWIYTPPSHKMSRIGKERQIFIGPKAQEILRPYLLRAAEAYCFSPKETDRLRIERMRSERPPRATTQYPSEIRRVERDRERRRKSAKLRSPGDFYRSDSYRAAIQRACVAAGVPAWFPYQLRHAAGTEIRRQFGLESAQVMLGHAQADVTQIYAERDSTLAINVAKQVG